MHQPVLYQEIIHVLSPQRGGKYVDATLGAGGHAWGILEASEPDGRLIGLDVDPQALDLARQKLVDFGTRAILLRASYTALKTQLTAIGWREVNGILLDLGVSSMQLDTPERGFSFKWDAPLDMRFDPENPVRAVDLVNGLPEGDLADLLFRYGEEHHSRQVARAIVSARPLYTTGELAQVVAGVTGSGRRGMHPATRTFQALRIAVNGELDALESFMPQAIEALGPGGRLAIISFHSLEDRIVKQFFRMESRDCICPPRQPVCTCGHKATVRLINQRPIQPLLDEIKRNPRSRSAKLRSVEKLANP
jgi:16S rRNA (cytosine1402-N4)-methyltransferase